MGQCLLNFGDVIPFLEETLCCTWCGMLISSGGLRCTGSLVALVHPPLLHSNYPITLITSPFINVGEDFGVGIIVLRIFFPLVHELPPTIGFILGQSCNIKRS